MLELNTTTTLCYRYGLDGKMFSAINSPLKPNLIRGLFLHSSLDFIVIVAIFTVGDTPLPVNVSPMPEITISPPSRFSVHPIGGKQAGRT